MCDDDSKDIIKSNIKNVYDLTREELKAIKNTMFCKGEKHTEPPEIDFKNKKYAYVTLVMLGDWYIPGAVVLAYSLIRINAKADRVILVTNDVSKEGREILSKVYDRIIDIDYIDVYNKRASHADYQLYLRKIFTKMHIFKLTEYEKVLFLDADTVAIRKLDTLFSLETPAGCYFPNKDDVINLEKDTQLYKYDLNNKLIWYSKYCEDMPHGSVIPKKYTDAVKNDRNNSGISAAILLIKPDINEFNKIIDLVNNDNFYSNFIKNARWPEQQFLTLYYSGKWHNMNYLFLGLQGYPTWKVLYAIQYAGYKPWFVKRGSEEVILNEEFYTKNAKYNDFYFWYRIFLKFIKKNKDVLTNVLFEKTYEIAINTIKLHRKLYDKKIDK